MIRSFPESPVTEIASIEGSEHKDEIFAQLLSGWSPTRVSMYLRRKYGELIDPRDVLAFLAKVASDQVLESGELTRRYKGVDVDVDGLLEIHLLLRLQRDQLDGALLVQRLAREQGVEGPVEPDKLVQQSARRYWDMLLDYTLMMHKIGELPPPETKQRLALGQQEITIREIIEMRSRTLQQVVEQPELPPAVAVIDVPAKQLEAVASGTHE